MSDFLKHRRNCRKCTVEGCPFQSSRKNRLKAHIIDHEEELKGTEHKKEQKETCTLEPVDLTTPRKLKQSDVCIPDRNMNL